MTSHGQVASRWRRFAWAGLLLLIAYHAIRGAVDGGDFVYHHWGAQRAWGQGADLFRHAWIYMPTASLILMPLGLLPFPIAIAVWTLIRLAAFFGILWMAGRWAKKEEWIREEHESWVLWGAVLLTLRPILADFRHTQINLILFGFVSWGCWLSLRSARASIFGGGLMALGGMMKGPPLLMLGFPFLQKRWLSFLGAGVAIAGLLLFSYFWFGPENNAKNWGDWRQTSHRKVMEHPWQERVISIPEMTLFVGQRLGVSWDGEMAQKAWLVQAGLCGLIFFAIRYRRVRKAQAGSALWDWAALGLGMALISPMTGLHHLVSILPAAVLIVGGVFGGASVKKVPRWRQISLILAGAFLLFGNVTPHGDWFFGLPDFTILFGLLLLAANLLTLCDSKTA